MKKTTSGFTIVELLIVIVVIGILAGITIVAFNGVQVRARDAERVSEISAIKKALENYYTINGQYPTITAMRTDRTGTFGLPEDALRAPNGQLIDYCYADAADQYYRYCYVPQRVTPSGDCGYTDTSHVCNRYIISYQKEANPGVRINVTSSQGF